MNNVHSIGIVADDLTSAADGAGPFAAGGSDTVVATGIIDNAATVLSIDIDSRGRTTTEAGSRAFAAAAVLAGRDILYKTVDSTLRGNIGPEVAAAFAASGRTRIAFAPAFPAAGRTTVGGCQFVWGVPVDQSEYARDPVHPAGSSRLHDHIPAELGAFTIIVDAPEQAVLDHYVAACRTPQDVFWVGSPGLAKALARRFATEPAVLSTTSAGRVLVVVGSANPQSRAQLDMVRAAHATDGGQILSVASPTEAKGDAASMLHDLCQDVMDHMQDRRIGAVIATGGQTMRAVLGRLDVSSFALLGEIQPGFPLGTGYSRTLQRSLVLAMKAGGFGGADDLLRAARLVLTPVLVPLR